MAKKLVKYKLIKFGNGYISPPGITDGGKIWQNTGSIGEMILVGTFDVGKEALPEGIIEVVTKKDWDAKQNEHSSNVLAKFKQDAYTKHTDPLFVEALRDKEQGKLDKWNTYLDKCKKIHDLTKIPDNNVISFE